MEKTVSNYDTPKRKIPWSENSLSTPPDYWSNKAR
jgi:hypothetical protein